MTFGSLIFSRLFTDQSGIKDEATVPLLHLIDGIRLMLTSCFFKGLSEW
jgi:hypothetical protein